MSFVHPVLSRDNYTDCMDCAAPAVKLLGLVLQVFSVNQKSKSKNSTMLTFLIM